MIPVDEYRALRLRAFPPARPPAPPPIDAAITRVEYELRAAGAVASGEARVTVDVLAEGWVRVDVPAGLLVRGARIEGRTIPIVQAPAPHLLLSKPGRVVITLDIVAPLDVSAGVEAITIPASRGAVSRVAIVVPREGIAVTVAGGVLAQRAAAPDGRWIAFGRAGQPLTMSWKRRGEERSAAPLKWRGSVTSLVGLGEDASSVSASIQVDVTQGTAAFVEVAVPDGTTVNQVAGPLVADWEAKPGGPLRVSFLEPIAATAAFTITGELRAPRDGVVPVPLIRLPAAERESGGVAIEVLGSGEVAGCDLSGLEPADPAELGGPVSGRASPSMLAFSYRAQPGAAPRALSVQVARYTPQAVLIASIEEARYDALVDEEGKTLVRGRYAVRNNQRAFLAVRLPEGATLWTASVSGRPLRPGVDQTGALLLTLEKGRSGDENPTFPVELTYFQRTPGWTDRGRARLALPALDLPTARTGVVLHHSPRFDITPDTGAFRVDTDPGPFTAVLRNPPGSGFADVVVERDIKDQPASIGAIAGPRDAGRTLAGPLPVEVAFPAFGRSTFLIAELTPELQVPVIELSYKRDSRW